MLKIIRTDSNNEDFQELIKLLDADLSIRDGAEHSFYAQFNKVDAIRYVVVAYENDFAVGCGAIKNTITKRLKSSECLCDLKIAERELALKF